MNVIGHFRREEDGFSGRIATLALDATLKLAPPPHASAKGPAFLVLRNACEVGAAWPAREGSGAILNVRLDDPSWPEPIAARLMASEDGVLPLVWMRRPEAPARADPAPMPPD